MAVPSQQDDRTNIAAFRELVRQADGIATRGVSGAASAQNVPVAAPGVGSALHVVGVYAYYSDGSDNEITLNITQGETAKTLTFMTGAQLLLTGLDLLADENTAVSVDAPAGAAGVTSVVQVVTYTEDLSD